MSSQQAYAAPRPLHKTGPSSSSAPYPSLSSGSTAPRPLHLHQQRACNFAANCIKKKDTCRFWHPGEPIAFYACLFDPNCRDKGKNCLFWHNGQPLPEGGVLPSSKGRGQDSKESAHKGPLHSMIACNTYQHCKKPAGQCKYWHSGDPVPAGGIRRSAAKKSNKFAASASSTISALSPEPTSQIYGGYEGPHVEYDINASRREILAQLTQHKLLLLRSHNGSGAATLLSQYLAEEFGSYGLVVQLQSSEASVGTVARQISLEFEGKEPGHFVAYHTASKRRTTFDAKTTSAVSWGNDTRIVVMSAAEFVRMCRDSNWLSRLSAVVCMDTHLRCMYTDVSMALCKQYIHQQHRLLLVASSAMVDDPALCSFLDASFDVPLSTLRVIRPSECLSIEYMPPNKNSTDERDANDILAESVLRALQYHLIRNNIPGNAIVYLPAPDDHAVAAFTSLLNQEKIRNTDLALIQVQELHELLSFDHQVAVSRWTPEKLGQRLVVFATDFATSSVSVPNVSLVIDTGTVSRTRNETLETVPVSKAMAELRKLSCAVFELALGPPSTLVWPFGSNSIAAKARTFRAILNKITPVTFENLVDMLLEVPVEDPETLNSLVEVIVDVAVSEPKLCAIYAKLCSRMAIAFKFEQEAEDGTKYAITFRSVLLNKCQGLFSDRHAIHIPEWLAEVERRKCEILEFKRRSQLLSLVKFVAELANHSVLSMNVVPQILDQLWAAKLGYEDLELFTVVLSTSGKQLPSANLFVQKCRDWIKEFTEREVQDSEGIRIRYLMQHTADLADINWVHEASSSHEHHATCVRLYGKEDLLNDLVEPEVLRVDLAWLSLLLIAAGQDPLKLSSATQLPPERLHEALEKLKSHECTQNDENGEVRLSQTGAVFLELALPDIRHAVFAIDAYSRYGNIDMACDVTALISFHGSILDKSRSVGENRALRGQAAKESALSESDVLFYWDKYQQWSRAGTSVNGNGACGACHATLKVAPCSNCRSAFATENGLHPAALASVSNESDRIEHILRSNLSMPTAPVLCGISEALGRCLAKAFPNAIGELLLPDEPIAGIYMPFLASASATALTSFSTGLWGSLQKNSDLLTPVRGRLSPRHLVSLRPAIRGSEVTAGMCHPIRAIWIENEALRRSAELRSFELCFVRRNIHPRLKIAIRTALAEADSLRFAYVRWVGMTLQVYASDAEGPRAATLLKLMVIKQMDLLKSAITLSAAPSASSFAVWQCLEDNTWQDCDALFNAHIDEGYSAFIAGTGPPSFGLSIPGRAEICQIDLATWQLISASQTAKKLRRL